MGFQSHLQVSFPGSSNALETLYFLTTLENIQNTLNNCSPSHLRIVMISSTRPMSDLTRPEWCMQFVICFDLYTTSHSHSTCHTHVKISSPHFYIISFSAHFLFHPVILQLFLHVPWIIHSVFTQSSSTAHSHVTHMSFLTLSLRPHQHPSLRSITLLSTFSTLHYRHVLVSIHHFGPFHSCSSSQTTHASSFFLSPHQHPSLWSISLMSIFSTHLKLPHIIPHMIYHTSPSFHPHSITSTPTNSPSVSPIVHL